MGRWIDFDSLGSERRTKLPTQSFTRPQSHIVDLAFFIKAIRYVSKDFGDDSYGSKDFTTIVRH
jgi:hypothetical protein